MGWARPQPPPRCPACAQSAYPAESIILLDRDPYHKRCIKCCNCDGRLTMGQIHESQGQLFCKHCYQAIFNTQYFSALSYNGELSEEDRQRIVNERQSREQRPNIYHANQFNGGPGPQQTMNTGGNLFGGGGNGGQSVQTPLPFPFKPGAPDMGDGGGAAQNKAAFQPSVGIQVGILTTIAPQEAITTSGL